MRLIDAFQLSLAAISLAVAVRLARHEDAWPMVVTYWIVLTAKNVLDVLS